MYSVSVIIPTRNRLALLKRAIKSVLLQTCKDMEIIIIDDCSTDGTGEYLANEQIPNFNYIKLVQKSGGAVARNHGIKEAKGKYIAFLDDDDEWLPDKLEKQIKCIEQNKNIGICYTGRKIISNDDSIKGLAKSYSFRYPPEENHYCAIMKDNFVGVTSSVLIPREILLQLNGFDEKLPCYQDYELFIRILKNYKAVGINEPLVNYYIEKNVEHVSFTREKVLIGSKYLLEKYKVDPYGKLLKKALLKINLKKMIKSYSFGKEVVSSYIKNIFHKEI
jgi:glycosyltransferase involved in cell wall biosynthesis